MSTTLEKAELLLGIEHIKTMLRTKPCDDSIIIKHTYRVRVTTYFDYDLFKFAYPDDDTRQVKRLECSYFLEQLLTWLGYLHPTQQKFDKITLWEQITGKSLYTGDLLTSVVSRENFFNVVGFFIYGNVYVNITHKFDTGKKAKLAMLTKLGEECFYLICDYLDAKYGEVYNNSGKLPSPIPSKYSESAVSKLKDKFDQFLKTNPKITSKAVVNGNNYFVTAFITDFESKYKATYSWAVDYLICEILAASGHKDRSVLTALKTNVQIPDNVEIISESKFYQLFGCCVALIAGALDQKFKRCTLRRVGKACFQNLVDYLESD